MDDATLILTRQGLPRQLELGGALADGVTPSWTEAVAIVREIATQLHRGGEPYQVPSVEDIAILSTGGLMLTGGRPYPSGPVAGIAVVMAQLLDRNSAPQPVLDIQQQAMSDPPFFESLIDFHNALDFYARPDAQGVLTDYYTRASTAVDSGSKNRALDELKEKTKTSTPKEKEESKKNRRPTLVLAAAIVVGGLAAIAAYSLLAPSSSASAVGQTANAALAAISETGKKMQDATTGAISKLVGGAEASSAPAVNASPADAAPPVTAPAGRRREPARAPSAPAAALPGPRTNPVLVAPSPAPAVEAPLEAPLDAPLLDTNVYTAASPGVAPPELVYPQLPKERKDDGTQTQPGDLDILVLEDGTVGEARLIPQSNRLQDRMMISAAKAWRFRPAQKDGRPVRYRVRVPITW